MNSLTDINGKVMSELWKRGDAGPAPATYIFVDGPPTLEECPDGYFTSSCGKFHQRANAGLLGCVAIILDPSPSISLSITEINRVKVDTIKQAMFKSGLYVYDDYDLATEEGLTQLFSTIVNCIGHSKYDDYDRLFNGKIMSAWPSGADSVVVPDLDWPTYYEAVKHWNSLPLEECLERHSVFIRKHFNLEFADPMKTTEDLIDVYTLLENVDVTSTHCPYRTIRKSCEDEWDLAT